MHSHLDTTFKRPPLSGDDIYIVGGRNSTVQNSQYLVDKYNIPSGKWEPVSPCFKIGYQGAAAACNGLLYTFCGQVRCRQICREIHGITGYLLRYPAKVPSVTCLVVYVP